MHEKEMIERHKKLIKKHKDNVAFLERMGFKGFCAALSIANLTGLDIDIVVKTQLILFGLKENKRLGLSLAQIKMLLKELGYYSLEWYCVPDIKRKGRTLKTFEANQNCLVFTKDHVEAYVDKYLFGCSKGRLRRVKEVWVLRKIESLDKE